MPGRRVTIMLEDSGSITLCVQRGFGICFYAAMAEAGIALAEAQHDGSNACFDVVGYESERQLEDACREWQNQAPAEPVLRSARPL